MPSRLLITGGALLLAAVVLALSVVLGPTPTPRTDGDPDAHTMAPIQDPASVGPAGHDVDYPSIEVSQGYNLYRVVNGTPINLRGESIVPVAPDPARGIPRGVSQVGAPVARIHLGPSRKLEIRADAGTLVMPDNEPRRGELHGRVVLTLYEHPTGGELSFDGEIEPFAALRVFLEDARFDLDLSQIESDSRVRLIGPRVEFEGRGLSLAYNRLRNRIERLVVAEGRSLRFKTDPQAVRPNTPDETDRPTSPPADQNAEADTTQWYRATLEDVVSVQSPDVRILGQQINVLFSLDPQAADMRQREDATPTPTPAPAATPAVSPEPVPGGDEVVLRWTGPLTITPEPNRPADLADARDLLVEIAGDPVRIDTRSGERLGARRADYLLSRGRLRLLGTARAPVTIRSPELGATIEVPSLIVEQGQAVAHVPGPGQIRAAQRGGLAEAIARPRDAASGLLPPGTAMSWQRGVRIGFWPGRDNDTLRAVRSIAFEGAVDLDHPDLRYTGNTLTLEMTAPDAQEDQSLASITGAGGIAASGSTDGADWDLRCDAFAMSFPQGPDGPVRVAASGVHRASQTGWTLSSDKAELILLPDDPTQPAALPRTAAGGAPPVIVAGPADRWPHDDNPLGSRDRWHASITDPLSPWPLFPAPAVLAARGRDRAPAESARRWQPDRAYTLHDVVAEGSVQIDYAQDELAIRAARLDADAVAGRADLFGPADAPAAVSGPGWKLSSGQITLDRAGTLRARAGELRFAGAVKRGPASAAAGIAQSKITWDQQMTFDRGHNRATFVGDVEVNSQLDLDTLVFSADRATLDFIERPELGGVGGGEDPDAPRGSPVFAGLEQTPLAVRRMIAEGDVRLEAARWTDRVYGNLEGRLYVKGPRLAFDNLVETLDVIGPGSLMVEDYRRSVADAAPRRGNDPVVRMAGRGITLFNWSERFGIDAARNDLVMVGDVQMVHDPTTDRQGQRTLQMRCGRLAADLETTGGLSLLLEGELTTMPRIIAIVASENVRIHEPRYDLSADTLTYRGSDRTARLEGDVRIERPRAQRAGAIMWNLATGELIVVQPGTAVEPIRRGP